MKNFRLTANGLKVLALSFMLLDHLWATLIPGNMWMTRVGRMAFPIFAFQIAEGYIHTRDFKKYATRLLAFALISEVPFDLMFISSPFFPFHQNVMFTLFFGLLAIRAIDQCVNNFSRKRLAISALEVLACLLLAFILLTDYNALGVLTVIVFYVASKVKYTKLVQLAGLIFINQFLFKGQYFDVSIFGLNLQIMAQAFAVFSLIFIWWYGGEKGKRSKVFQYAAYSFYPVHMLVLYILTVIL